MFVVTSLSSQTWTGDNTWPFNTVFFYRWHINLNLKPIVLIKIAVSHLNLLRSPGVEPGIFCLWDRNDLSIRFTHPQYIFKKHSIAPPVPDFVFRETVYVQVFWFVRTIIHPTEGYCLEMHAYEITVVMFQHLSCIQDEMFYLYPQKD